MDNIKAKGLTIIILASIVFFMVGCLNNGEQQTEVELSSYFPLQTDNFWNYEGYGNEYASYSSKVLHQKDNRYQVVENNGGTRMLFIYEIKDDSIILIHSEEEFYEDTNVLDQTYTGDRVILQKPLTQGASWTNNDYDYTISDTNITVSTKAGTFENCLAVEISHADSDFLVIRFYAPEVGLVKTEFTEGNVVFVTSTLEEFLVQ